VKYTLTSWTVKCVIGRRAGIYYNMTVRSRKLDQRGGSAAGDR
jgi:hypothetical protein